MQKKILVLDDDELCGKTIVQAAKSCGFDALYTSCPEEFFNSITRWHPDIIALDLLMPGMDGISVMERLSRQGCRASLILTSGVGEKVLEVAKQSALRHQLNLSGILPKPFRRNELKRVLFTEPEKAGGESKKAIADINAEQKQALKDQLALDISQHNINIVLQPKIACDTETLMGFEILSRWTNNNEPVSPELFIEIAEEGGLIDDLTRVVFHKTAAVYIQLKRESDLQLDIEALKWSVNLSAKSLSNKGMFDSILNICREAGLCPQNIILELTETSAMQDSASAYDTLTRLRLAGFELSIDDFGTGYSSMLQLVRLPFSEIKIDKSFVLNADTSEESCKVINSVVQLGNSLSLSTTAEGVESQKTLEILSQLGCTLAQGFGIAKPMKANELVPWYKSRELGREKARLEAIQDAKLLAGGADERLQRIIHLCAEHLGFPVCFLSVIDDTHQHIIASKDDKIDKVAREHSVCQHALKYDSVFEIPELEADERFQNSPVIKENKYHFYLGHAIKLPTGEKMGTLCLLDYMPRNLDDGQYKAFSHFVQLVEKQLSHSIIKKFDSHSQVLQRHQWEEQANEYLEVFDAINHECGLCTLVISSLGETNRLFGRNIGNHVLEAITDCFQLTIGCDYLSGRTRGSELTALCTGSLEDVEAKLSKFEKAVHEVLTRSKVLPTSIEIRVGIVPIDNSDIFGERIANTLELARASSKTIWINCGEN